MFIINVSNMDNETETYGPYPSYEKAEELLNKLSIKKANGINCYFNIAEINSPEEFVEDYCEEDEDDSSTMDVLIPSHRATANYSPSGFFKFF